MTQNALHGAVDFVSVPGDRGVTCPGIVADCNKCAGIVAEDAAKNTNAPQ